MAPHSSQEASRSGSSKKDSKDKDKGKYSRHHTTGGSSSRNPVPEEDEHAEFSSRKEKSVLHSAFFKDQSRAPFSRTSGSHHTKDPKASEHESHSKRTSASYSHGELSKFKNPDRDTNPPMKYEDRPEKASNQVKLQPNNLFKTTFTDPKDIEMAEKQTRLKSLKPEEVAKQHKCAQGKLHIHGACPAGYTWWEYNKGVDEASNRLEEYRCFAGNHLVTHELLAEAQGGFSTSIVRF
ncbi:hypothetical protein ACEPPN_008941 [Leptodophora sp. 'Broadleaf-Isolate-01']